MWFCDPPGHSGVEYLQSYSTPGLDFNYVFLFDQEPINYRRIRPMTQHIYVSQNNSLRTPGRGSIVTSEFNSSTVQRICQTYDWDQYYYFFGGWAALDWFRGYDKTFVMTDPQDRTIVNTFISPNRIVSGERNHRLLLLYWLFKLGLAHNLISCPRVCPAENIDIVNAAEVFKNQFPDIGDVFDQAGLPLSLDDDNVPSYASATLDLYQQASSCLLYLVTETVGTGQRLHLTEKIFKPICMQMPFVLASTQGSLAYLRSYGFQTFADVWDESYDNEADDNSRMQKIAELMSTLDQHTNKQQLFDQCRPIIQHNYNHFYNGGFEHLLWQELKGMLNDLQSKLSI